MKKLLIILFVCLITVCFCSCTNDGSPDNQETVDIADTDAIMTVSSPYADFAVPASFSGKVDNEVTSKEPYTLTFKAKEDGTVLFSVIVDGDGEQGVLLGTLVGDAENHVLYAVVPEIDKSNKNYEEYCEYQEGLGVLTAHLSKDYDFEANVRIESSQETYDIKTDVVTLKYPAKWKDKVTADVSAEGVRFSADGIHLFDFLFSAETDGFMIGTYNGTPISIVLYDLDSEHEEEKLAELNEMQEDSNTILDYLESDPSFVSANAAE